MRHHRKLIEELQGVANGECDRLMVAMPPGSAKSTYGAMLFPPWFLAQKPGTEVIGAAYNSEHAEYLSGRARNFAIEQGPILGYSLLSDSRRLWQTDSRGLYRAAGAGGGITGRRADLVVIDDPFKGRQEAESAGERDNVWNWYRAEVVTRLKPKGRIVLINTRWHEDDLSGRLLAEARNGTGAQWRVLNLPAIAEEGDQLGREPGEPLWPEWENLAALARKRSEVGEREWASLYQQRPSPLEGTLFKAENIGIVPAAPAGGSIVRAWDLAATEQIGGRDPDWTVGLKLMRDANRRFYVLDVVRLRGSPNAVEKAIINTAAQDGPAVRIGLPQDPGQAGKQQVQYLTSRLDRYRVESSPETGSKETRAMPVASQTEVGNVALVKADWNRAFLEELIGFPSGTHDDQVDALSRGFGMLVQLHAPMLFDDAALAQAAYPGQSIA
jgi:predicted phage terminase large subunit-like protein